jgi:hypothetical protein
MHGRASALTTGRMCWVGLWLRLENSTPSNIEPVPIKFGGTLNCRAYSMGLALVAMV